MEEMQRVRRKRRLIGPAANAQPQAPTHAETPAPSLDHLLRALILSRREVVRRHDYKILGRVSRMSSPRGIIFFPHYTGPTIAFVVERDGNGEVIRVSETDLVIVSEWQGLPTIRQTTSSPCPECMTACDVCASTGEKTCERCGGDRVILAPSELCPAPGCALETNHFNSDCKQCRGAGMVLPRKPCPGCNGSGQQTCPACRGAGQYPTGNAGGAKDWRTPNCLNCRGTKFAGRDVEQIESDFLNWEGAQGLRALGPINGLIVESVGGTGTPSQNYNVIPDQNGDYMVLVLDDVTRGAYLYGGVLQSSRR